MKIAQYCFKYKLCDLAFVGAHVLLHALHITNIKAIQSDFRFKFVPQNHTTPHVYKTAKTKEQQNVL